MNPTRSFLHATAAVATAVALWPAGLSAQHPAVHGHGGTHVSVGIGVGFGWGYGYPIYGYPYFYSPFWWGYGPYWAGYPGYAYPYYPYPYYYPGAQVRIQVQPRQAEVYLDGYLVGTVDNFDGTFQRLDVPLGEHDVTLYSPGYRTISQRMLFRPATSYKIKDVMQPLPAGEQQDSRPTPAPRQQVSGPEQPPPPPRGGEPRMANPDVRLSQFGTLSVRVQPIDAEISIDGERWEAPGGERIVVELGEGTHRIEVRKEGYTTYAATARIRAGETTTLNVSLSK